MLRFGMCEIIVCENAFACIENFGVKNTNV